MSSLEATPERARRQRYRGEWLLLVVALAIVGAMLAYSIVKDRHGIESQESDRLQVQARVVHENISAQLNGVNNALEGIRTDFASADGHELHQLASRRMRAMTDALPGMHSVLYLDAAGTVRAAHRPEFVGQDLSRRDYFRLARASRDSVTLHLSAPFKSVSGVIVINATKILLAPNGDFAGVLTASLDPDYFNVVLRSVLYAPDMRSTVVHGDGIVFLNMPLTPAALGVNVAKPGSFFTRHRDTGKASSILSGKVLSTGALRTVATRTIVHERTRFDKPLVVHVSREHGAMYDAWQRQAIAWTAVFTLLAGATTLALVLSQRRRGGIDALIAATERDRAESAQRLRAITDNIPALISHFDRNERCTFTNPYCGEIYGVDHREMVGKAVRDVRGEASYAKLEPHIREVMAGYPTAFENHTQINGRERYFQQNYVPDIAPDGEIQGFYSVSFDVTERKQVEIKLGVSEARVRSILAHAPDAFIEMDTQGRISEWNRRAETIFGWQRSEVIGRSLAETIIPERMRALHNGGVRGFVGSGAGPVINNRIEVQALHRDGHEIPVEVSIGAVRTGDVYIAVAFLHDIGERKAAEARLAASTKRLRDITNNIPALIGYFDADERCEFANDQALKAHRIERSELRNHTLRSALGEANYGLHEPHVAVVLSGKDVEFEGQVTFEGRETHYRAHLVADRAEDSSVRGFYLMTFDVTALKQVQRQLVELARIDSLTGLPNRRRFEEKLPEAMARSRRDGRPMALMVLDLDHFKSINDSHGHAGGDAVLKQFASRLLDCVRVTDTVARLAGDEFVIILEGLKTRDETERVARKIGFALRPSFVLGRTTVAVSSSIGIAFLDGEPVSSEELVAKADAALYGAKRAGRDTFAISAG